MLFSQNNTVAVLVSKFKKFRKKMNFKNLGDNFCVCRNGVNVAEYINEAFDCPLIIRCRNMTFECFNKFGQSLLKFCFQLVPVSVLALFSP